MTKKRLPIILAAAVVTIASLFAFSPVCAAEESVEDRLDEEVRDKLDDLDYSALEQWFDSLDEEYRQSLGGDFESAVNALLAGEYGGDISDFFSLLLDSVAGVVTGVLPSLVTIFAVAILYSIVSGMSSSFLKKQTVDLIGFVCYAAMVAVALARVVAVVKTGTETINSLASLMNAAFPVMLTLLTALGGVSATAAYSPMMAFLSGGVAAAITGVVIPLFIAATALGVVGHLSSGVRLGRLQGFFTSAAKTILAALFGLFVTVLTVKGLSGSLADGISLKTAKFAVQSYIPLLGGYLSDGFDVVLASVVLIKNSAGAVIAMMTVAAIAVPVIEIAVTSLGFKLVGGLIEPFSDGRFGGMLSSLSKNMSLIAEAVIGVGVAFIITVMLIVASCNSGVV